MKCILFLKKKTFRPILLLIAAIFFASLSPRAYAAESGLSGIKSVSIDRLNGTIIVNSTGVRPSYKEYDFRKGHKDYFILVFANSILYSRAKKIDNPFGSVFSLSYAQFSGAPDYSVHVVLRRNPSLKPRIKIRELGVGRYQTIIYLRNGGFKGGDELNGAMLKNSRVLNIGSHGKYSTNFTVFIDAGHGGNDPGGIGPEGLPESFVNLSIAMKLKKFLRAKGIRAEIDRTSNINLSLAQRVLAANKSGAKLFIGLYCNSTVVPYLYGTTSYYFNSDSFGFARYLNGYIASTLSLKDDGVKRDDLYVIRFTKMPSVIIEYAYISNPHEESLLASATFRRLLANGISNAVYNYFIKKKH